MTDHTPEPWVADAGTGLVGTTASGAFETLAVLHYRQRPFRDASQRPPHRCLC